MISRRHLATAQGEEVARLLGPEIADGAAEEDDQAAAAAGSRAAAAPWALAVRRLEGRQRREIVVEVGDDAVDRELRVLGGELLGDPAHAALGDVHRHVEAQPAGARQGVDQHARLGGGAGADLDQLRCPGRRRHPIGDGAQQGVLGAGLVVLGKAGDALEQPRAALVVEVARRDLARRPLQRRPQLVAVARDLVVAVVGRHQDAV